MWRKKYSRCLERNDVPSRLLWYKVGRIPFYSHFFYYFSARLSCAVCAFYPHSACVSGRACVWRIIHYSIQHSFSLRSTHSCHSFWCNERVSGAHRNTHNRRGDDDSRIVCVCPGCAAMASTMTSDRKRFFLPMTKLTSMIYTLSHRCTVRRFVCVCCGISFSRLKICILYEYVYDTMTMWAGICDVHEIREEFQLI